MADNNGIATDPDFRCGAKGRHGWRPHAETHCGRSTALIASAPALDAGARAGKLMRRSENSSSKARPTPVVRPGDMAPAAAVGADKMEVPARHVDRGRGGRETEADQGTVDVVE